MTHLTSFQRKIAYSIFIVVLVIPIIVLGMPAGGKENPGGQLSRLRREFELGEATMGNVDPTSATMNLVLLGLRGLATNLLWLEHEEQKRTKQWAKMRATTDSIILLQPHFQQVWRFHGWDLAYNVSVEWDAVEDRYYWVKQGAKFSMRGTKQNAKYPELYWTTGRILGEKIGSSDERRFYRKFFKADPNEEEFQGGPDPDINPTAKDNYLAARDWFQDANDVEDGTFDGKTHVQHIMMRALFRSYPARSRMDYAESFQRDGLFGERQQVAWHAALEDWTKKYGQEIYAQPNCVIFQEVAGQDDFNRLKNLKQNKGVDELHLKHWLIRTQNVTNYRYWKKRSRAESEPNTMAAHRHLYQGKELFKKGNLDRSLKQLEQGLFKFEAMLNSYPQFRLDDNMIEEGLMGVLLFQRIHQLLNPDDPLPESYHLKTLWEQHLRRVSRVKSQLDRELQNE